MSAPAIQRSTSGCLICRAVPKCISRTIALAFAAGVIVGGALVVWLWPRRVRYVVVATLGDDLLVDADSLRAVREAERITGSGA